MKLWHFLAGLCKDWEVQRESVRSKGFCWPSWSSRRTLTSQRAQPCFTLQAITKVFPTHSTGIVFKEIWEDGAWFFFFFFLWKIFTCAKYILIAGISLRWGTILSDVISLTSTLKHGTDGDVALAVSGSQHVYAGDSLSTFTQLDIGSERAHKSIVFPNRKDEMISEVKCVGDKIFICLRDKGCVLIFDPRTDSVVQEVKVQTYTSGLWAMDTSENSDCIALASSCGNVSVHDLGNTCKEIYSFNTQEAQSSSQKVTVNLSPTDSLLSLSGFDKTVEILNYKSGEGEGKVFCHDGHRGEGVQGIVTHMWHPSQKNLLFSADNTGKLNAWSFKLPVNNTW